MTSPLSALLEKQVEDLWHRLDHEKITPWAFMTAGQLFRVTDFYGRQISYQGIAFEGSPRQVFWSRYIEPFLEEAADKVVKETLSLATEKKQDARVALAEASGLIKSLVRRAFHRMANIDRRLRGNGYPESVAIRSVESNIAQLDVFIDRRVSAELAMLQPKSRVNDFYNDHPFLFWLVGLVIAAAVSFAAT